MPMRPSSLLLRRMAASKCATPVCIGLLLLVMPLSAQQKITEPWLWVALPYDGYCSSKHADYDFLSKNSGGSVTENALVRSGAQAGDRVGPKTWTVAAIEPQGSDNLHRAFRKSGLLDRQVWGHAAYGVMRFDSESDQETVWLRVGSDDAVKVWLNGSLVHSNITFRYATDYQDELRVNLKRGSNLMVVKVFQCTESWSLFIGIDATIRAGGKTYKQGPTEDGGPLLAGRAEKLLRAGSYDAALLAAGTALRKLKRDFYSASKTSDPARETGAGHALLQGLIAHAEVSAGRYEFGIFPQRLEFTVEKDGATSQHTRTFEPATLRRVQLAQQVYRQEVEALSEGSYSIEFHNTAPVGMLRVHYTYPRFTFDMANLDPGLARILSERADSDTYSFYMNTHGITGVGNAWVSQVPILVDGQQRQLLRAVLRMSVPDSGHFFYDHILLEHEHGHVFEAMTNKTFVHCKDQTAKLQSLYPDWDGNCKSIYDYMFRKQFTGMWSQMNFRLRSPAAGPASRDSTRARWFH